MKEKNISIFNIWLWLYLIINFYACILGCIDGVLIVEQRITIINPTNLIIAFLIQCAFLFVIYIMYKNSLIKLSSRIQLKNSYGFFILFLLVSFIIFNYTYGVNVAGQDYSNIEKNIFLNSLFVILQPYNLFFIISILLKSERLFIINCITYTISAILSGWAGAISIVITIFLCRHNNINISIRSLFIILFTGILIILISPLIFEIRHLIRTHQDIYEGIYILLNTAYFERIPHTISFIINRFQHVGNIALYMEYIPMLKDSYAAGLFSPYWGEGLPQYLIMKYSGLNITSLGYFLVSMLYGNIGNWSMHPGIGTWIFILQENTLFFILYYYLIIKIPFKIVQRFGDSRLLIMLSSFAIIYLWHGWIMMYFNLALYIILFLIFYRSKFIIYK